MNLSMLSNKTGMLADLVKVITTLLLLCPSFLLAQNKKPNIVLIMADDMGYSDIGCYGGEINTPNLDKLAAGGLRFKQFYNGARCCPSRASLMTGLYAHQTGIGHMTNDPEDSTAFNYGVPAYQGGINKKSLTIAEVLKTSGYQTMMAGKWHIGYHNKDMWPLQRGFDKYYGILAGATNYFHPHGKRGLFFMNTAVEPKDEKFYITDAFTDYAIRFVKESREESEKPFFLYLAYTSPHWPLHALKEDIDKYRGKYKKGWRALRRERLARMKSLGIISPETELSADDGAKWDALSDEQKEEMDYRMAIYAAQVDRMDQNIGRLLSTLKETGELDNTLIFFLTDNGACAEGGEMGGGEKELLGSEKGYLLSYGQSWANASATPFKRYKHWVHEGGIATPLIVHWPQGMPTITKGHFAEQYAFLPDIMATIVDITQADYPKSYNGFNITPLEGSSMLPLLQGKNQSIHQNPIYWEHEGNAAVREGDFKLVKAFDSKNSAEWELYNIRTDRAELNNLAGSMPKKVKELARGYDAWALRVGVMRYEQILQLRAEKRKQKKN